MEIIHNLVFRFHGNFPIRVIFLYCFIGVFIGTLIGVLPGIGPVGAMSLLLPATFKVSPLGVDYHASRDLLRRLCTEGRQHRSWSISRVRQLPWLPV